MMSWDRLDQQSMRRCLSLLTSPTGVLYTRFCIQPQILHCFSESDVDFIWFTDEKIFTVSSPSNTQNDRLYVPCAMRKKNVSARRLLHTRATFSQSLMVSVGISKLGMHWTDIYGSWSKDKWTGTFCWQSFCRQYDVFQETCSSSSKTVPQRTMHGRDTIELLCHNTPDFIAPDMWPPNSLDLNPVDYVIWSVMQERVYQTRVHDIDKLRQHLISVWCELEQCSGCTDPERWWAGRRVFFLGAKLPF